MKLATVIQTWMTVQYIVYSLVGAQWSDWEQNVIQTKWRRVKLCADYDTKCIREEETTNSCLSACRNASLSLVDLTGFQDCISLCSKSTHSRTFSCGQHPTCQLVQKKRCYNSKFCFGQWNEWKITDISSSCAEKGTLLYIRYCNRQCPLPGSGGSVNQTKQEINPRCPTTTTQLRTLASRPPTSSQTRFCAIADCEVWTAWGTWSSCDAETNMHKQKRLCDVVESDCLLTTKELEETKVENCKSLQSQLLLGFSIGISGVVILGVVVVFYVKCKQTKRKEATAHTNLLYIQSTLPTSETSTWTLYNSQRQLPNVPGDATPHRKLPSPPYSSPFDAIDKPSPHITMTSDSIYATLPDEHPQ